MNVLLVTATRFELIPFLEELKPLGKLENKIEQYQWEDISLDVLICGVGMVSATYQLTTILLTRHYDYVINAGISGSYHKELKIGTVVNVTSERFSTLGVDRDNKFQTLFEAGFLKPNQFPYHNGALVNPGSRYIHDLPEVSGITSNTIRISRDKLPDVRRIFNPDVESTEGGAVFYVCLQRKVPFLQLRAISNYIEDEEWNIPLALENLRLALFSVLNRIITTTKVKEE